MVIRIDVVTPRGSLLLIADLTMSGSVSLSVASYPLVDDDGILFTKAAVDLKQYFEDSMEDLVCC